MAAIIWWSFCHEKVTIKLGYIKLWQTTTGKLRHDDDKLITAITAILLIIVSLFLLNCFLFSILLLSAHVHAACRKRSTNSSRLLNWQITKLTVTPETKRCTLVTHRDRNVVRAAGGAAERKDEQANTHNRLHECNLTYTCGIYCCFTHLKQSATSRHFSTISTVDVEQKARATDATELAICHSQLAKR